MTLLVKNSTEQQSTTRYSSWVEKFKNFAVFGYSPIIHAGIVDSVNPGALLGVLLFAVYLVALLESGQPYLWRGLIFVASIAFTTILIQMGFFNLLLSTREFAIFLDGSYFLISIGAIAVSAILLYDWKDFRKNQKRDQLRIQFSFLDRASSAKSLSNKGTGKFRSGIVGGMAAYFLGIIISFLETAWPPNTGIVYILYELTLPEGWKSVVVLFSIYALFFVFPLLIVLLTFSMTTNSSVKLMKIRENFSKLQIIAAAILMGYGIAFLMEFIL